MPPVVSASHHPAIDSDGEFFRRNPNRLHRARPYVAGDFGGDPRLAHLVSDDCGRNEITTVIVKRREGFRIRLPLSTSFRLSDDRSIVDILRSRGIDGRKAYSIDEFCGSHGIFRAMLRKLLARDPGPRLMRVGARVLVSEEAARDWRRAMETTTRPA
jgi:hypothetical protein